MNVRNFWIEADIDGYKAKLRGGPRAKDGGFTLKVFQRSEGEVKHVLTIEGFALMSKQKPDILKLAVDIEGEGSHFITTNRDPASIKKNK